MKRKTFLILLAIIVVVIGGFFAFRTWRQSQGAATPLFQTVDVTRGDLTALVGATGTVHANQTTQVNWQTTGRIGTIKVKTGDVVTKGQELAELDPASLPQTIIQARADLITARRNLQNLQDSNVAQAQAKLNLEQAKKALQDAQDARDRLNYKRASQAQLDSAQANYILAKNQLETAQELYDAVKDRAEDDVIRAQALSQLGAAQSARDRALANLNYLLGLPDAEDIATADAKIEVAKANLADAQREWDRLKDGPDPQDIAASQARIQAIESMLNQVVIYAPIGGTITQVDSQEGDQVSPGTASFRIDDFSRLLVDVQVTEVDINRVKVGQPVQLSFDAIQGKNYNGLVTEVSSVGTSVQGVVNFTVTIEMEDADQDVLPGMTAAVNVVVNQLKDVLLIPNRAVRVRNGQRVVYVLRNGQPTIVQIELGASSDTNSQVLSGDIKEGDKLVLNPPPDTQNRGGPPFGG